MDPRRHARFILLVLPLFILLPDVRPLTAQFERLYEEWRWVRFDVSSGLPSPRVLDVFEASDGKVWALTSAGLAWFDGYRWTPVECAFLRSHPVELPGIVVRGDHLIIAGMDSVFVINAEGCYSLNDFHSFPDPEGIHRAELEGIVARRDTSIMIIRDGVLKPLASPLDSMRSVNLRMKEGLWGFLSYSEKPWLRIRDALYRWTGDRWKRILRSTEGYLKAIVIASDVHDNGIGVIEAKPGVVSLYHWTADGVAERDQREEGDLIKSISYSPAGEVLTVENTGVLRMRRDGKWSRLRHLPAFITNPLMIKFRGNGDLWVGTADGLFLCRMSSDRWTHWSTGASTRENIVNEILPVRDGSFWIGTRDGLQIRDRQGRQRSVKAIDGMGLGRVTGIGQAGNGDIWISSGASFTGAYRWDGRTWKHFGAADGLTAQNIHKIVHDRRGRLWFLGIAGGMIQPQFSTDPGAFILDGSRFTHWGSEQGMQNARVYSMVEDRKGALWFGTYSGLSRLRNGKWKHWNKETGLRQNRVFALAVDSTDRVWLAHNWQGLGYIDDDDSVQYYTTADGLVDNQVWGVTVDPEGRLWVATMDGIGCYADRQWLAFDAQSGLPNTQLWPVVTFKGNVYGGTQGNGVAVLHYKPSELPDPRIEIDRPFERADVVTIRWQVDSYWADPLPDRILTRNRVDGGAWAPWSLDRSAQLEKVSTGAHVIEVQSKGIFGKVCSIPSTYQFDVPRPFYLRFEFLAPILVLLALLWGATVSTLRRKKRFEMVLRDNEQRFRAQYQSNPIPAFTWRETGDDFILIDCNGAGREVLTERFGAELGTSMNAIESFAPAFAAMARSCYRDRSSGRAEFTLPTHDGSPVFFDMAMAYVPPDMLLVHGREVTQEKLVAKQIETSREHLRALAARLESVREEERKELSREIHDELGQAMTGLKMDIAWIGRRLKEGRRDSIELVGERLTRMGTLLDDTLRSVRRMAGNLRPVMLDDLGLASAVDWQAKEFQQRTGIPTHVDIAYEDSVLSKNTSTEVFRIFQELLTNIARHAGATAVDIRLEARDGILMMQVTDNGCGIAMDAQRKPEGLGILGMEERARRAGGTMEIESSVGHGTTVRVSIPLKEPA
jgi:signal transduction histidine kinase/ligand-binding sensor domain-containing protein